MGFPYLVVLKNSPLTESLSSVYPSIVLCIKKEENWRQNSIDDFILTLFLSSKIECDNPMTLPPTQGKNNNSCHFFYSIEKSIWGQSYGQATGKVKLY